MQTDHRESPKSLSQKVAAQLREAIILGKFGLGVLIPEEKLAQSFGVSRTPVREALNILQLEGLVVIRPQVGSFVFSPTPADLQAMFEFRTLIEPQAARLSYQYNRQSVVEDIEMTVDAMTSALNRHDLPAYGMADANFHQVLFNYCANPYLQQAYQRVAGRVAAVRNALIHRLPIKDLNSYDEHKTLAVLFAAGKIDEFDIALVEHIQNGLEFSKTILPVEPELRRVV